MMIAVLAIQALARMFLFLRVILNISLYKRPKGEEECARIQSSAFIPLLYLWFWFSCGILLTKYCPDPILFESHMKHGRGCQCECSLYLVLFCGYKLIAAIALFFAKIAIHRQKKAHKTIFFFCVFAVTLPTKLTAIYWHYKRIRNESKIYKPGRWQ